ncbi:conjugal transfer protein [Faecalicatena acetigenes]|uniref:Conjugal transfer protein n=1 Tax=Faecalicatena acetigenes TaxID=2981790 RepID=A0ABT2TB56_9FIRM|nr:MULTISPECIES: TcpE family conjugal transfer membrane protein [Lachnospiraceae]MCU6747514.1 conjugal transfer protein [Faecalicatena acetigenes]SCH93297.1 TcpE family [uncultured Clostridium sp.]
MDRMKSYTGIWSMNKSMYIGEGNFTFRISFIFAGFLAIMEIFMFTVGAHIPLFMFDNPLVRYAVIPFGVAYIMDTKSFEERKPYNLLLAILIYLFKGKDTFLSRKGTFKKMKYGGAVTAVRRGNSLEELEYL